jgi:hypothetical protein
MLLLMIFNFMIIDIVKLYPKFYDLQILKKKKKKITLALVIYIRIKLKRFLVANIYIKK